MKGQKADRPVGVNENARNETTSLPSTRILGETKWFHNKRVMGQEC